MLTFHALEIPVLSGADGVAGRTDHMWSFQSSTKGRSAGAPKNSTGEVSRRFQLFVTAVEEETQRQR